MEDEDEVSCVCLCVHVGMWVYVCMCVRNQYNTQFIDGLHGPSHSLKGTSIM